MNEIFKSIYDRLVAQLSEPVFDHVPQNHNSFPYVRIDPIESNGNDSDSENGFNATVQIIGFSRYRGSKEVAELQQNIYNALHRWGMPDTTSYGVSTIHQEFSTIALENDGQTRQSIQRFNIIFEPLPILF